LFMALDCESGEPRRNRTFNPQIKSPCLRNSVLILLRVIREPRAASREPRITIHE